MKFIISFVFLLSFFSTSVFANSNITVKLNWRSGSEKVDLDLYIKNPNGDIVNFSNRTSDWGAEFVNDNRGAVNSDSFETFTVNLNDMDCYMSGRYQFYIHHWSGPGVASNISADIDGQSVSNSPWTFITSRGERKESVYYDANSSNCSNNTSSNQEFSLIYAKAAQAVYNKDIQYIEDNGVVWKKINDKRETYYIQRNADPLTGPGSTIGNTSEELISVDIGFHATVYSNGEDCIMAFEGTNPTSFSDWFTNISHVTSSTVPAQYIEAKNYLNSIIDSSAVCDSSITVVGHSLGGGLATFSGLSLGINAFVFNPAGLWSSTIDDIGLRENSSVTNYIANGYSNLLERELSDIVSSSGILFGDKVTVSVNISGNLLPHLTLHSMDSILLVLSNLTYAKRYVEQ